MRGVVEVEVVWVYRLQSYYKSQNKSLWIKTKTRKMSITSSCLLVLFFQASSKASLPHSHTDKSFDLCSATPQSKCKCYQAYNFH